MSELNEDELRRLLGVVVNLEDTMNKTIMRLSDLRVKLIKMLYHVEGVGVLEKPSEIRVTDIFPYLKDDDKVILKIKTENLELYKFVMDFPTLRLTTHKLEKLKEIIEQIKKGE